MESLRARAAGLAAAAALLCSAPQPGVIALTGGTGATAELLTFSLLLTDPE